MSLKESIKEKEHRMSYKVEFLPTALKSLKQLDRQIIRRILDKISWLAENFSDINHIPLTEKGQL